MFASKRWIKCYSNLRFISVTSNQFSKFKNIDKVIPQNIFGYQNGILQKENGRVYDSKPFKLTLQKDKVYSWCLCGHSKSQPLCDGTHKIEELQIKLRPIFFKVAETKEYWICNCKQTEHRPFCDGSHIEIQKQEEALEREKAERIAKKKEESE